MLLALVLSPPLAWALSPVDVFRIVRPAVVAIYARDADAKPIPFGFGSGVIIAPSQVVTNCHVLEQASTIDIVQAGQTQSATLEHRDPTRDLCLLRVPTLMAAGLPQRSRNDLVVGEAVYALGNVMGLGLSFSEGLISALPASGDSRSIQTTALLAPGSSGGGLFDAAGQLIGLTVFQDSEGQKINFALPTDWLSEIAARAQRPLDTRAEETAPNWQQQATSLQQTGQWPELLAHAQRWVAVAPESSEAFFTLALAQHVLGHYHEATQAYETTVRLQPQHIKAWSGLSMAYTALERWDQALAAGVTATRRGAPAAIGWVALGKMYRQRQHLDKAVEAFVQATRVDPDALEAWRALGQFYLTTNQLEPAVAAFRRVADLQPDEATHWLTLGALLVDLGKPKQALKALQRSLALGPETARAHLLLASAYGRLRQPRKTLTMLHQALNRQTEPAAQAQTWVLIGETHYNLGHYAIGIEACHEALRWQPQNVEAMTLLSKLLRATNRFEEALASAQEAVALEPRNATAWDALAAVYFDLDRPLETEAALRQTLQLQPDLKQAWHLLGWTYHQLGDRSKVRETYLQLAVVDRDMAAKYYRDFMLPYGEAKPQ